MELTFTFITFTDMKLHRISDKIRNKNLKDVLDHIESNNLNVSQGLTWSHTNNDNKFKASLGQCITSYFLDIRPKLKNSYQIKISDPDVNMYLLLDEYLKLHLPEYAYKTCATIPEIPLSNTYLIHALRKYLRTGEEMDSFSETILNNLKY